MKENDKNYRHVQYVMMENKGIAREERERLMAEIM